MTIPSPLSIAFVSHGGGPLPLLGEPMHQALVANLKQMASLMPRPQAIIVVSAHWEAAHPTVTSSANPALIYDYSGFPPESYRITYPAPGSPGLAEQVQTALTQQGMTAQADAQRGFDHGMFVPLKLMFPEADIPCVQLSLCAHLNPSVHLQIGQALRHLADQSGAGTGPILLLGSGFSFHNLRAFFSAPTPESQAQNMAFEHWLHDTCTRTDMSESSRQQRLLDWAQAPSARYCHPREEHLMPLHVCYGAAQAPAKHAFLFDVLGKKASAYLW